MVMVRHVALGAAIGFVSAVGVDLDAWSKSPAGEPFNVKKAVARWVSCAIAGASLAMGGSAAGVV